MKEECFKLTEEEVDKFFEDFNKNTAKNYEAFHSRAESLLTVPTKRRLLLLK